jgi:hypothetical protein
LGALGCFKPAWEHAFSGLCNERAWGEDGLRPFTRRPYYLMKAKEEMVAVKAAACAKRRESHAGVRANARWRARMVGSQCRASVDSLLLRV